LSRNAQTLISYATLFLVAVPWYWHDHPAAQRSVFGFPLWVAVSLVGAAGIALQTAWVLRRPWPGEEEQV
jgi:hypothetical protein